MLYLFENITALPSNMRLPTRINAKPKQLRPTVTPMDVKHIIHLYNLIHIRIRTDRSLFFLAEVFSKLVSIRPNDADTSEQDPRSDRHLGQLDQ